MTTHSADESWQEECRLWVPGDSQNLTYGHIDYDPQRGLLVHLIDTPLIDRKRDLPPPIPSLHGESLGGVPFSLLDLEAVGMTSQGKGNTLDAACSTLARGIHVERVDDLAVDWFGARFAGLLETLTEGMMCGPALFTLRTERDAYEERTFALDGAQVHFSAGTAESFSRHTKSFELGATVSVSLDEPVAWPACRTEWVEPLRDLTLFSTRQRSWIEELRVHLSSDAGDEPGYRMTGVELIERPEAPPTTFVASWSFIKGFNLGASPDPEQTLRAWFELHRKLGPIWRIYFGTLNRADLPGENWLLNLTAFAEGYHRTLHDEPPLTPDEHHAAKKLMLDSLPDARHRGVYGAPLKYANSQTQASRIEALAHRAAHALAYWKFDPVLFRKQAIQTRNWLTHLGDRGEHAVEGPALVTLVRRLELILRVNLILDLGLAPAVVSQMLGGYQTMELLP